MKNILLVSTDDDVLELIQSNSNLLNADIEAIDTAYGLLSKVRSKHPDLLIIDFILNDDNGGSLCHQIKSDPHLHDLPVILLSDYPNMERFATKFGCDAMLNKPFDLNRLAEILNNLPEPHESY